MMPSLLRRAVTTLSVVVLLGSLFGDTSATGRETVVSTSSAPRLRGVNGHLGLTEEDVRHLAENWQANSLRTLISHGQVIRTTPPYDYVEEDLQRLDAIVDWCEKYGITCIINIHEAPGYLYVSGRDNTLWTSKEHQDRLLRLWEMLARRYRDRSSLVCYDLLNEPHGTTETPGALGNWNRLARELTTAIRRVDPAHTIIVEATHWAFPRGFHELQPTGDPNTVYDFHWYAPKGYTHAKPEDTLTYPGELPSWRGGPAEKWDKKRILEELEPVFAFERKYRVPVRCGEFGVVRWAGGASRFLEDCVSIFEEHGYDWNYYAYREWQAMNLEFGSDPAERTPRETDRLQALRRYFRLNGFRPRHE